jgi:uncharacterized membrane protein
MLIWALEALAVLFIWMTSSQLPARVASHFDASGAANGFLSQDAYRMFMLVIVVVVPIALYWLPRRLFQLPDARINIPNADYWLTPQRRNATIDYLSGRASFFAGFLLVFLCYVHWLVVRANALTPPVLSSQWFLVGLAIFLIATMIWVISMVGHFRNAPR